MSASEKELDHIFGQGNWEAPNLLDLRMAFTSLDSTMKALAESPGWEGASAAAASEKWVSLQKEFGLIADSVDEVRALITKGNAALSRAKEAVDGAPAVVVPKELKQAAAAADAGALIFVPALGSFHPASTAVSILEGFLGNKRAEAANAAKSTLDSELTELASNLNAVDFGSRYDVPEPQKPIPDPVDGGSSTPTPSARSRGGYTPPPNPVYTTPTYPRGNPSTPTISDPYPDNPRHPSPSVDDGSGGTRPNEPGGSDPRHGIGGPRYGGGGGSGSGSGVNGAVFGGAAAAGAATIRFGTGGGFGGGFGGGMGGGGLGAGAAGGSGGLLGSGTGGASTAGSGAGGSAGAGAGAGATGAGNRGGMMGGQQMGGGGQAGKKEKRAGLGGPIAPKLEDDEAEFVPLPDGARAGGRDVSLADES